MKHFKNILLLFTLAATIFSCKKNVVEYDSRPVVGEAEFQLHYFVPLVSGAVNNIYKVEINGQLYANESNILSTYNAIPSGGVGRFFTTKVGQNNIKMYKSSNMDLVYDQNVEMTKGKQNVFVYDFNKPPVVIDAGYPFNSVITDSTARVAWVRFYNFLFEKPGEPTTLKLQYQRQYTIDNETNEKSDWLNVGEAVAFGEGTSWQQIEVNRTIEISSSYARVDYRIRMIDASGADIGPVQVLNASNKYVDYSDWWTAYVGRRYMHIFSGFRADKPTSAVRQFTAL